MNKLSVPSPLPEQEKQIAHAFAKYSIISEKLQRKEEGKKTGSLPRGYDGPVPDAAGDIGNKGHVPQVLRKNQGWVIMERNWRTEHREEDHGVGRRKMQMPVGKSEE